MGKERGDIWGLYRGAQGVCRLYKAFKGYMRTNRGYIAIYIS